MATPTIADSRVPKLSGLSPLSHGNLMTKEGSCKKNTKHAPLKAFEIKSDKIALGKMKKEQKQNESTKGVRKRKGRKLLK